MFVVNLDNLRLGIAFEYPKDLSFGRVTFCKLFDANISNGKVIASGLALCAPQDTFRKEQGRKLALARAMKELGLARNDRAKVWEQYHTRKAKGQQVQATPPTTTEVAVTVH